MNRTFVIYLIFIKELEQDDAFRAHRHLEPLEASEQFPYKLLTNETEYPKKPTIGHQFQNPNTNRKSYISTQRLRQHKIRSKQNRKLVTPSSKMALETEAATPPGLALAETNINWDKLDKTRFHLIGAILFTAQQGLLHPTAVVKTRMQVDGSGLSHLRGMTVFRYILRNDGLPGIFRGFATSAIGSIPGRVLHLTSLEISKDMMLKYMEGFNMPEATRLGIANAVAGMSSNFISSLYFVPLDVICQRLMVQGLPGTIHCNGALDIAREVVKAEGFRGLFRGFGLTAITQSPASALWWGTYGAAQHIIWRYMKSPHSFLFPSQIYPLETCSSLCRSLGYKEDTEEKPSQVEIVAVQASAGMVAGASSSVITTPIDTVKTRLQVMDNFGAGRPSVMKTTRALLEEDGWRGFYRGFWPRFVNMSLYGTTMVVTYELIKRLSVKQTRNDASNPTSIHAQNPYHFAHYPSQTG
ncbi:Mitochondrial substrate/solute carrier [Dillenia turbinata]|uniref:Mitochondrial substrate/solute carrier n=1 Tax=Dillenia turbinata TaxID=194707 RepID=A0AAN8VN01_9MAGN